ncbi:MAG: endonuclease V [Candidatus Bathyarchaeota archaeon]
MLTEALRRLKVSKNFDVDKARQQQINLAKQILVKDKLPKELQNVAGADVAYKENFAFASIAVLSYADMNVLETQTVKSKIMLPYFPTLLSFREGPAIFEAFKRIKIHPDVMFVNGQGIAHPYGCGLASHVGVVLKLPTIGVTKSLLCGEAGPRRGKTASVIYDNRTVGVALYVKPEKKPVYVSIGNMISLERAVDITLCCFRNGKLPEPLRVAHRLSEEKGKNELR